MTTRGIIYTTATGAVLALGSSSMTISSEPELARVLVHDGGDYIISAPFAGVALLIATLDDAATADRVVVANGSPIYTPPASSGAPTVFEISPGQLRNRMPWQSESWLEENQRKADADETKVKFAAVIWGRIKDSKTINVLSQNVIDLGAAMVALSIAQLDAAAMAICLTPRALPGETRDGLIG